MEKPCYGTKYCFNTSLLQKPLEFSQWKEFYLSEALKRNFVFIIELKRIFKVSILKIVVPKIDPINICYYINCKIILK